MSVSFYNMLELLDKKKEIKNKRINILDPRIKQDKNIQYYITNCLDLNDKNINNFECEYLKQLIFESR